MHDMTFRIEADGSLTAVYHPNDDAAIAAIQGLGTVISDQRVGHVWPVGQLKRLAFRALRRVFGGRGYVAEWTRNWGGRWVVVLIESGEKLPGTFASHDAAVEAEVAWSLGLSA
jgi:hypothetical protein